MNTETKGKPIGKILLIFFLVLAFTGIGILLQVFVRQSTDLTAKKDSESEIQKQIENKNIRRIFPMGFPFVSVFTLPFPLFQICQHVGCFICHTWS